MSSTFGKTVSRWEAVLRSMSTDKTVDRIKGPSKASGPHILQGEARRVGKLENRNHRYAPPLPRRLGCMAKSLVRRRNIISPTSTSTGLRKLPPLDPNDWKGRPSYSIFVQGRRKK